VGDVQQIKYEFRVHPGADPSQIRLRYRGIDTLQIEPAGDLALDTPLGTLRDPRPFSYQESEGARTEVVTHYALTSTENAAFGFALADYDRTKPLIIDPAILVYASYLGGSGEDRGTFVAVDRYGAAYISGITSSTEASFPTGSGFGSIPGLDTTYGGGFDVFVAKVLPSGTGLAYVTYLGGSGNDVSTGIAVDSGGNAYVTGYTNNVAQFPAVGGPTTNYQGGSNDIFIFKLNPSGTALVYSGFIGGDGDDREPALALDNSGSVYLTGLTYSSESTFPTGTGFGALPGADQTSNGDADAFVVKVKPDGSGLQFASYIGGNAFDNGYNIGIDAARNVYVGGNAGSNENTFPDGDGVGTIPGPDTTYNGGAFDAFVVKLNPQGTSFVYVTFVGGAGGSERDERYATGLAVDPQGSAWIAGGRASAEDTFPTGQGFGSIPGFDRTSNGGRDGYLVKINSQGTAFDYATYIGGSGDDEITTIAVDSQGRAYLTGWTSSTETTFPDGDGFGGISGPDTTYNGGPHDVFVVELNTAGTGVVYATYIGGPGGGFFDELGTGIAVDGSGNAYVTGYTTSGTGFPGDSGFGSLPGFDQSYNGGLADAFIVKISPGGLQATIAVDAGNDTAVLVGTPVSLQGSASAAGCVPAYSWRFIGRPAASAAALSSADTLTPSFTPDIQGVYTAELTVSCGSGLGRDTVQVNATSCTGANALQISPVSVPPLGPGRTELFRGFGGSGTYGWALASQSGSSLSSSSGASVTYTAGSVSGTDVVTLSDLLCGSRTLSIKVDTMAETAPRPQVLDIQVNPNPTQGADSIFVQALFDVNNLDAAEVCVDSEFVRPPGGCRAMNVLATHLGATLPISVMSLASSGGLAYGHHFLTVRGHNSSGWGWFKSPAEHFDVNLRVAILLLNGYNFCGTGPQPEQWWEPMRKNNEAPIACQIRDYFFGPSTCELSGPGTHCAPGVAGDSVCVVDNLDGRGDVDCNLHYLEEYIYGETPLPQGRHCEIERPNNQAREWLADEKVQLILIGHSYGGQIARKFAAAHPEKVVGVITLDTPHRGAGTLGWVNDHLFVSLKAAITQGLLFCPLTNDMSYDHAQQYFVTGNALEFSRSIQDRIVIDAIASQGRGRDLPSLDPLDPNFGSLQFTAGVEQIPNGTDNVVPFNNQKGMCPAGAECNFESFRDVKGVTLGKPGEYSILGGSILHNAIIEKPVAWGPVFEKVKGVLDRFGAAGGAQGRRQTRAAAPAGAQVMLPVRPARGVVAVASGRFDPVITQAEVPFSLEAASELVVSITTESANPMASLTAPSGTIFSPGSVDGLTTLYSSTRDELGTHQVFVFRNPEAGLWSLSVAVSGPSGPHVPVTGSAWKVTVAARSSLALEVGLDRDKYLFADPVSVLAKLGMDGSPIGGATALASIESESGVEISSTNLYDDGQHGDGVAGDGVYGGSFAAGDPGDYVASVTASGMSTLGAFSRQAEVSFSVGSGGAAITGPFIESAPDADGDGSYDSLDWSFTVALPAAGNYTCLGDLLAADGSLVTQAIAKVAGDASGTYPVTLSFPGLEIYRKAKLGPYTLSNLRITLGTPEGERLAGRATQTVLSSGPYWSWMSFERDVDPQLTWVSPAAEEVVSGNSFELQWNIFDGNGATTLDIYYDTTGSGFAGAPIVTGLAATQGAMTYTWDMTGLPDGVYFVYARVRNGEYSDAIYSGSIRRLLDSDGDGLPDALEAAHGLNPASSADTYLDPDGDGLSNFDEYPNGTDPQDADTDNGGEPDLSEAVNGRDGTDSSDDVTSLTLVSVSPGEGDSRGGEQVLVLGSGFQNGATVDFGGAAAPEVTFVNSTRLVVTTPSHPLGTVNVTVSNPGGGSTSKAGAFAFLCEFVEPPVAFSNVGTSGLCAGQDVQLGTFGISGATFSWTGPNGFTSNLQNPTISQAGAAASGTYTVSMQIGSCSLQASADVLVRPLPTAIVSGDQAICPESSASIQATLTGEPPWSLEWSDGLTQSGITTSPVTRTVSPTTNTTYFVSSISDSYCGGTVSGSAAITVDGNCTMLHTLTPCRVLDTRGPVGDNGGPALRGGLSRVFPFAGRCGIPATAKAVAVNVTVAEATQLGHLRLYPGGDSLPGVSTINFLAGLTRANNAIVRLGTGGAIAIYSGQPTGGTVQVIVDVTGYFE
jgi:hypothetical protein